MLRETLEELRRMRGHALADRLHEWAAERGLQVAAQALFDCGNHLLSGGFGERVDDYASIPPALLRHGVIDAGLEGRLRGLAGFRNLLVHDYFRIDVARVRDLLDTLLDDLEAFAAAVEAWLDANP